MGLESGRDGKEVELDPGRFGRTDVCQTQIVQDWEGRLKYSWRLAATISSFDTHTHKHTHTHTHMYIGTCVRENIPANIIEALGLDLPIESALQKAECFRPLGLVDSERLFWWNPSWPPRVVETIRVRMAMCVGAAALR